LRPSESFVQDLANVGEERGIAALHERAAKEPGTSCAFARA
jgi:hypothetical protein